MEKTKRSERLGALTRILTDTPNRIHTLSEFCERFGAAKSTISEDIDLVSASLERNDLGRLETVAGAAGGVRYRAIPSKAKAHRILMEVAEKLSQPGRMLPGGFLYNSDISSDSVIAQSMGEILAAQYYDRKPDFVLTMETKGIPIALMTARMLDVKLVIARRDSRAYEGSAVKINYIAGGGNDRIETMALARRAVQPGQRALIIDDFMKGGGTLQGMVDMMREFQAEVVGVGVMIATAEPKAKRVEGAKSLLILEGFDREKGTAIVHPSEMYQ
ncbi:MAG: pur operon repressor [Eubacteriales bacterium]|nr:pur operon repressor [Eubacteriales bacterium]